MAVGAAVVSTVSENEKDEEMTEESQVMTRGRHAGVKRHRSQWKTVEICIKQRP